MFSGNLALYPRWAIACGNRLPDTSLRANANVAIQLVNTQSQPRTAVGFLTCRELGFRTEQWLLNNLVELLREPFKHWRYSYNHVFEDWCLYVERAVDAVDVCLDSRHDKVLSGPAVPKADGSGDFGDKRNVVEKMYKEG